MKPNETEKDDMTASTDGQKPKEITIENLPRDPDEIVAAGIAKKEIVVIDKRLIPAIGLCVKAGKTIIGVKLIEKALSSNKRREVPLLVLEAGDCSLATHLRLVAKCSFYSVRLIKLPFSKETLASAVGKTGLISAVAVTDFNLSRLVENYLF